MLGLAPPVRSRWGRTHLGVCREVPESGTSLAWTRRVGGSPSHAPPRTGRRVWGPVPWGSSPPPPYKMAAAAAHVTGAPAPPLGGRAEAGPRLPRAPLGLRRLGPGSGQRGEPRGRWTLRMAGGIRVAALYCPGSNLLDTRV